MKVPHGDGDVVLELGEDSPVLAVAFGGLLGHLGGVPSFEFMRMLSGLGTNRVFVRDPRSLWYHGGVRGLGSTINELGESLASLIGRSGVERVVFLGSSAGGYAAVLLSTIVTVQEVLAFSPQTFLDPRLRAAAGDERWPRLTEKATPLLDPRYTDLLPVLAERSRSEREIRIAIHYSVAEHLDTLHAERLLGVSGVELVPHALPVGGHNLPALLKEQGSFEAVVAEAVTGKISSPRG